MPDESAGDTNHPDDPGGGDLVDQSESIVKSMVEAVVSETGTGAEAPGSYASVTMTSSWGLDGIKCQSRSYEEILIEAEKSQTKNVLRIKIEKLRSKEFVPGLSPQDIENILFDEVNIDIDEVREVDLTRYGVKEVYFNSDHDLKKYERSPFVYKGHMVSIGNNFDLKRQTKVTFLNVPRDIPDEEIIHFCSHFGKVKDKTVYYGKHHGGKLNGLYNGSRWVEMEIDTRKDLINYVWWESPLSDSEKCRITVTYGQGAGRGYQCGHCLKTSKQGCPGGGKAKVCREKEGVRANAIDYMKILEDCFGYKTMKQKYLDSKTSDDKEVSPNDVTENENQSNSSVSDSNSDDEVASLTEKNTELQKSVDDLKKSLSNQILNAEKYENKMKVLRTSILKHLEQSIPDPFFESSNMSLLVTQLSFTLKETDYEVEGDGKLKLKQDTVFKDFVTPSGESIDSDTVKANFAAFIKAVESRVHVRTNPDGERRLSIGGKEKRKLSDEKISDSKKLTPPSKLPTGKNRSGKKSLSLQEFHSKN